ncbi:MAG: metallophosphoesterase [Phycisphaerae bacterium]|nr:metallophosphoesterase [Phycisphaerae bacterium]
MFGTGLTLAGLLLHLYVFWRAASVPFLRRHMRPSTLLGIGLALLLFFIAGRTIGRGATGVAATILELLAMTWLASLFLMALCLVLTELVTCGGFLLSRHAPALRGWALVAGGGLSLLALVQGMRPPAVESYEVSLAELPPELNGTVLVAMSDLHLDSLADKRWLEKRVAQVQALNPDIVVLLGDIFEGHGRPHDELIAGLNELSAPLGVWAVLGNHEHYGRLHPASRPDRKSQVEILDNRCVEIRPGLNLAGVEDLTVAARRGRADGLVERTVANRTAGATILLSHTPWQTEAAAACGVGLMLCGHTHSGQIWPLGYLVRTRYPLLAGRYQVNGMTVLVCRGTGTWGPCMRLWKPGEIMRVTLRRADIDLRATSGPG